MIILRQYKHKDCTLAAVMNCVRINNPLFAQIFTQKLLNEYMPDYWGKTPREAFYFLKEKGHYLRLLPISTERAKIVLKQGKALVGGLKGYTEGWWQDMLDDGVVNGTKDLALRTKGHAVCFYQEKDKIQVYDSNLHIPYGIDLEKMINEGVVRKSFFQIR